MVEMYEESEVLDIVLDVVNWVDRYDEQFDLEKSEQFVLPYSVEDKAEKLCDEYGREQDELNSQGSLSNEVLVIDSELDEEYVADVLEYLEESNLSRSDALAGLKMRESSKGKGGRPSKVDKWQSRIEDGSATLEDAREDMSDPTWYKLRDQVE